MILYGFNENKISDAILAVDFGSQHEWLGNMIADTCVMLDAILNATVTKYIPDEDEQEVAIGVIKSLIIDNLIGANTDLKGFKDIVLGGQQGQYDLIDTTAIDNMEEGDSQ